MGDRNFDDLAHRFENNIQTSSKGEIRRAVIQRDFDEVLWADAELKQPLRVLDAGGGQGQMAVYLAECGCEVVLCDVSVEMLKRAQTNIETKGLADKVELYHGSIQQYLRENSTTFDLVICHALLEWVEDAQVILQALTDVVKAGGYLSLLYYNLHGLVFKNLLRTNFKKIESQQWQGSRRSLTPTYPLTPEEVNRWLGALPLKIKCESGVRVFNDFVFSRENREREPDKLLRYELEYSRLDPYKQMARYIHLLACKSHPE